MGRLSFPTCPCASGSCLTRSSEDQGPPGSSTQGTRGVGTPSSLPIFTIPSATQLPKNHILFPVPFLSRWAILGGNLKPGVWEAKGTRVRGRQSLDEAKPLESGRVTA